MSHDHIAEKLIRMANQIATFFKSQPAATRMEGVATHINKFWEPRMRRALFDVIDHGGEGLDPLVLEASALITRPEVAVGGHGAGAPAGSAKQSLPEAGI